MSGYAGELFVRVTPDAQGFDQKLAQQVKSSTAADTLAKQYASAAREIEGSFKRAGQQIDKTLFASAQGKAQALRREIEGLGRSGVALPQLAGGFEQLAAAETQAKAALDQYDAGLVKTQVLQDETRVKTERMAQTFRSQLRNVAAGQASVGSLLSPRALAGFGIGSLAVGAAFQGLQHVADGLRVTGDEAFTAEGKLRNLGAALTTGDIVGGVIALGAHAESASKSLEKLLAAGADANQLSQFAASTREAADSEEKLADRSHAAEQASKILHLRFGDLTHSSSTTAAGMESAANKAEALSKAFATSAQAAYEVEAAIQAAGSAAAAFGPERGGPGGVAAGAPAAGIPRETPIDQGNTQANLNAIAEANARTDAQRLKVARDEQAQAKRDLDRLTKGEDGYTQALLAYAQARQRADQIAKQIEDKATADAERRAREAEAAAEKRKRLAEAAERKRQAARREALRKKKAADEALVREAIQNASGNIRSRQNLVYDPISGFFEQTDPDRKATKSSSGESGFTLSQFFAEAGNEFNTYGSNIAGRNGILSGQDARAALGASALRGNGSIPQAQLSEAQKQTALLTQIAAAVTNPGSRYVSTLEKAGQLTEAPLAWRKARAAQINAWSN